MTTQLTVQTPGIAGLTPTNNGSLSASETYQFANNGRTVLRFAKTAGPDCTVTFTTPGTVGGVAISDPTVTVGGTSGERVVGPFPTNLFNDDNGYLNFTLSSVTGLTVAVISA